MGFNYWALVASDWALKNFDIKKICCFGRQVIHIHDFDKGGKELQELDLTEYISGLEPSELPYADTRYFPDRGVAADSLDYSSYEGASIIADLSVPHEYNQRLKELAGRYDAVFDIGTTEHVGNTFASIQNAMMLLKPGGLYFYDLPYTNWMDHGLIQFCPSYFAELCRTNEYNLLFQLIHPTCREGDLIFLRDNVTYCTPTIMSLFGCIQKGVSLEKEVKPPVQTFCSERDPLVLNEIEQKVGENLPILNVLRPSEFLEYMSSSRLFPLYWRSYSSLEMVGHKNIFSPTCRYRSYKQVTFF
jgi:hypothetical protein